MDRAQLVGFISGIAFALIFVAVYRFKRRNKNSEYDERQKLARGKAFQWAFYTLVVYTLGAAVMQEYVKSILFTDAIGSMIGVFLAMTVFAIVCIIRDAYVAISQRPRKVMFGLLFAAAINIAAFFGNWDNELVGSNKKLNICVLNLTAVVSLLLICLALLIKLLYDRRNSEMEE